MEVCSAGMSQTCWTFAHLREGTRPSRKSKGIRNVKGLLNTATIDSSGLLIISKPDPYLHVRQLIVVPREILPGILHVLHLYFTHCTESQLTKLFNRYFHAISSNLVIKSVVDNCHQCSSLKKVLREMFEQSSTPPPTTIGQKFAADIIKRQTQAIFALRDIHSAYTTAVVVPDEKASSLKSALLSCSFLLAPTCSVRVNNPPGLRTLKVTTSSKSSSQCTIESAKCSPDNRASSNNRVTGVDEIGRW